MHSLQVTPDDVALALNRLGVEGFVDEVLAERWLARLDLERALSAADACDLDIPGKSDVLVSSLGEQLRALGVPGRTLADLVAEEEALALASVLAPTAAPLSRPRV